MSINPFLEKPKKIENCYLSYKQLSPKPYDKNTVDPYTRVRCILMNGTEYEAVWSKHHCHRHCPDNDIRRRLAVVRRQEQQQQKLISALKPLDENLLETTIGYEQLAVDLTAFLAQRQKDEHVKQALDFALLEDFDHLYRYSNLLESDMKEHAEKYVGSYTEIMPGRPTVAHPRDPVDSIKRPISNLVASPITKCDVSIITAAEQQTMNYYMNLGQFYKNRLGRELYTEIGMVEEQHVTQYGALIDPTATMFEDLIMHEYTECYLYLSMAEDEIDAHIRSIWEMMYEQELAHLHEALDLMRKYETRDWWQVFTVGEFPELLKFSPQKEYIRKILGETVENTADGEGYVNVKKLPKTAGFFKYQAKTVGDATKMASHVVIENHIADFGEDYRVEDKKSPVKALQNRKEDNVMLGRE